MRRALRRPRSFVVDGVVIDQCAVAAATGGEAVGEHPDDFIEFRALEGAIGIGAANELEQLLLIPLARGDFRDDLLGEHIEGLLGNPQAVELAATHGIQQCGAFDEIVARQREEPSFRRAAHGVPGAAHPLQKGCDRAWRADLTHEIDVADVDAQLQGCRGDERFQLPLLRRLSASKRSSFAMLPWCAVTSSPPTRSDRWRAMRSACRRVLTKMRVVRCSRDQLGQSIVDQRPDFARHHRFERRRRNLDLQVAVADVAGSMMVQSASPSARDCREPTRNRATSSMGFWVADNPTRVSRRPGERLEALQRQREMQAALRPHHRVNFVDDHGARRRQHLPAGLRAKQDVQRFGCGDHDVRWPLSHGGAFALRRVARANERADVDIGQAQGAATPSRMPASGASRLRRMSFERALSGET